MDRGHVDRITRQFITGWAADELNPDRRVMVSVFVNGHKIAQFACDQPRSERMARIMREVNVPPKIVVATWRAM